LAGLLMLAVYAWQRQSRRGNAARLRVCGMAISQASRAGVSTPIGEWQVGAPRYLGRSRGFGICDGVARRRLNLFKTGPPRGGIERATQRGMPRRSLEDLVLWEAAREIARGVYRQTGTRRFNADPHLRTELRTTARTIMANIAAGYGADEAVRLARGFDHVAQAAASPSASTWRSTRLRPAERHAPARTQPRSLQMIRGWQRVIREHEVDGCVHQLNRGAMAGPP
jgi:hypothetical protein